MERELISRWERLKESAEAMGFSLGIIKTTLNDGEYFLVGQRSESESKKRKKSENIYFSTMEEVARFLIGVRQYREV